MSYNEKAVVSGETPFKQEPIIHKEYFESDFVSESVCEIAQCAFQHFNSNVEAQINMYKIRHELNSMPTYQDVIIGKMCAIAQEIDLYLDFLSRLPGFDHFSRQESLMIIKDCMFSVSIIKSNKLLVDGECRFMFPNGVHYSKYWMQKIIGEECMQTLFDGISSVNKLNLTVEELSLTIILISAISGKLT